VKINQNDDSKRKKESESESEWESSDEEVIKKHESSTRARTVTKGGTKGNDKVKKKKVSESESEWESSDKEVIKKHESTTRVRTVTNVAEVPPVIKREIKYAEKKEAEQATLAKIAASGPSIVLSVAAMTPTTSPIPKASSTITSFFKPKSQPP